MKKPNFFHKDGLLAPQLALILAIFFIPVYGIGNLAVSIGWFAAIIVLATCFKFVEVDFNQRKYKIGVHFLIYKIGEWEDIPEMQYISIIGQDREVLEDENGLENSAYFAKFEIRFFQSIRYSLTLFDGKSKEKIIVIGKILAEGLNEKLLDATVMPPKFI